MAANEVTMERLVISAILVAAILMRWAGLGGEFDYDGYDEGVYWQTLRAMSGGQRLYTDVFCSQPPLFIVSIYPFYRLLGSDILAARVGVATLSLLGFVGAYLLGAALAGRRGAILALTILVLSPLYLKQSQTLEAEGPATAFTLLSAGGAFLWWNQPGGRRGLALAAFCGITMVVGILIKALDIAAVLPLAMLAGLRLWTCPAIETGKPVALWVSVVACGAAAISAVGVLVAFLGSIDAMLEQTVLFHIAAREIPDGSIVANIRVLFQLVLANPILAGVAVAGLSSGIRRRDLRVFPMVAWLVITLSVLVFQVPLFARHAVILIPPLLAMSVLGMSGNTGSRISGLTRIDSIFIGFLLLVAASDLYKYYSDLSRRADSKGAQLGRQIAADVRRETPEDQWIITDAPFIAALANCDTPPWLADTSSVRIKSGYLTTPELTAAAADPRNGAVLFVTGRLINASISDFRPELEKRYYQDHIYAPGMELWVR